MPLQRVEQSRRLHRRATFDVSVGNADVVGLYYVNATVGTPGQDVQLQLDTGSSDIWMFGPNSCENSTSICAGGECEFLFLIRDQYEFS